MAARLELPILRDLGRVLVVVLAIYGILRFEDLYHRGVLRLVFVPGYEQGFFLLEMFLSVRVPAGAAGCFQRSATVRRDCTWSPCSPCSDSSPIA